MERDMIFSLCSLLRLFATDKNYDTCLRKKSSFSLKNGKLKKMKKKNHLRTRINIHAWFSLKKMIVITLSLI